MDGRIYKSSKRSPKFGMCCFSGKIKLPKLENPPPELIEFLTGINDASKKFRENIRQYNNALAMTSIGIKQDYAINQQGGGPWLFKIQGKLSHYSGSLFPEADNPTYVQWYIYDLAEALNHLMAHQANTQLDRQTMQILQDMLY